MSIYRVRTIDTVIVIISAVLYILVYVDKNPIGLGAYYEIT